MSSHTRKTAYVLSILIYILCVTAYAAWSKYHIQKEIYHEIDQRLTIAATGLKYMLKPDFHDRAVDENSISFEEELENREAISKFNDEAGFKWSYTLVEKDGRFYFSAPTVTAEEARERKKWYFYPYEDVPPEFVRAFQENITTFSVYTDQWGRFRSIAKPEFSPGGRKYLACADYDISYVQALLKENLWESVIMAALFLLFSVPFILAFRSVYKSFTLELEAVNKELADHRDSLEILVETRTQDLKSAKDKSETLVKELEKTLEEVKTLRGFLPICSKCKKIRDDQGYWQQIEQYIQDHSEAAFTHSICPDCLRELAPELADRVLKKIERKKVNSD
ncbi:MAG: hypothetical protein AB1896_09100 [Thermodesulfobacteriota bacterium]